MFIGRTDVEAETPILWTPDGKSWLTWKDPDAGKDWGQEEKGTTEDEMVGWHHWLNAHGFGWTPAVGDTQGGMACCGSWGRKDSDVTERLSWTELNLNPEKSNYDWTVKLILSGFLYRNCCALNRYIEYLSSWSISGHFSTPFYWKSEFVLAWCNFILSYKSRLE